MKTKCDVAYRLITSYGKCIIRMLMTDIKSAESILASNTKCRYSNPYFEFICNPKKFKQNMYHENNIKSKYNRSNGFDFFFK